MANPIEFTPEMEEALTTEVMSMLEAEPTSAPGNTFSTQPDIPAQREDLAVLVCTGKAKEAIGVQLTHDQVKRLTDKEVEKYTKRYETYVGSKTTDSLIDSFLFLVTTAAEMRGVKIKDIDAYQKELKNNFNINKELSTLSGKMALKFGRLVAVASAAMITAQHIDFGKNAKSEEIVEQSSPTDE